VRLRAGLSLTQMMIFQERSDQMSYQEQQQQQSRLSLQHPLFSSNTPSLVYDERGEPLQHQTHGRALILSLNVPHTSQSLGFEAFPTNEVIDLSKIGELDPARFFRPLTLDVSCDSGFSSPSPPPNKKQRKQSEKSKQNSVTLEKDKFYILATKERVSIPHDLSAEMVPFSQHIGELRAHYAGFFDPGFGWDGKAGGSKAVLEVRSYGVSFTLEHGQVVGWLRYGQIGTGEPEKVYGRGIKSHYQGQGLALAKQFRPWPKRRGALSDLRR